MLETTYQLPPGLRGGKASFDTYGTNLQIFCFINPFVLCLNFCLNFLLVFRF